MGVLDRLFRRAAPAAPSVTTAAAPPPTPAATAPAAPASSASDRQDPVPDRERRVAERLLEDEALRGDLDDATWQPVQDWLLARVHQLAAATAALDDAAADSALESGAGLLRNATGTLVGALEAAGTTAAGTRLETIHHDLRFPVIDRGADPRAAHAELRDAARAISHPTIEAQDAAGRLVEALAVHGKGGASA